MSTAVPAEPSRLAFSYKGFRFFWLTTLLVSFAVQIMSVSIAWQIYDVTGNVFLLGLVGLCLFLPALLLILVTGLTADRFNRRMIMAICLSVELLCALGFLAFVNAQAHEVWPIFGILIVLGIARAPSVFSALLVRSRQSSAAERADALHSGSSPPSADGSVR